MAHFSKYIEPYVLILIIPFLFDKENKIRSTLMNLLCLEKENTNKSETKLALL